MSGTTTAAGEQLYVSTLDAKEGEQLDKLYKFAETLLTATDVAELAADFNGVLQAASSPAKNVRGLAAQLIPKHLGKFPEAAAEGLKALVALCGDSEVLIRANTLKGLHLACKTSAGEVVPSISGKAAEVLVAQLTKDKEDQLVKDALDRVTKMDVKSVLDKLFCFMEAPEGEQNDALRETAVAYLQETVSLHSKELIAPFEDAQELIKTRMQGKVLEEASETEFKLLIEMLKTLKIFHKGGKYGPQGLADIVVDQAVLSDVLDPTHTDELHRVLECVNIALPFFKAGAEDIRFSCNIIEKIMPGFDKFGDDRVVTLQRLCQLAPWISVEAAGTCVGPVFALLMKYFPEPKPESEKGDANGAAPIPEIAFTFIEALLYLVHMYGKKNPAALNAVSGIPFEGSEAIEDKLKIFKEKLLYNHEISGVVLTKLQAVAPKIRTYHAPEEQPKKKMVEQGITSIRNIVDMSRPLATAKPYCLTTFPHGHLSWERTGSAQKRALPDARGGGPSKKPVAQAYVPVGRR